MAKKTTKKKTTKKQASKPAHSSKKKVVKKTPSKSTTKKTTKKTTTKKSAAKKTTKKPAAKKTVKKTAAKTTKKTAPKSASKKTTVKKSPPKKASTKKTPVKKTPTKKKPTTKKTTATTKKSTPPKESAPSTKATEKPAEATPANTEQPKRTTRRRPNKPKAPLVLPDRPLLGSMKNIKPLIASGSAVKKTKSVLDGKRPKKIKSPFNKRELDGFKAILLAKRAELLGDITHLENEALKSSTGDSSHSTNHISEQGSDNYDQALNLNLAAADRNLIMEIDDALERIVNRTYGACMITGEPIKAARLEELPWAKYSIKAAQELDRRGRWT